MAYLNTLDTMKRKISMPTPLIIKANSFPSSCSLFEMGVLRADFTAASSLIFEASATALSVTASLRRIIAGTPENIWYV